MLIEYTIDAACEPKRRFGEPGLFGSLRRLARLLGSGTTSSEQRTAARQAEFELRPLAFHCARCPANHPGRAFGCFGIIQAPITEYAEEWLLDLLPDTLRPRPATSDDPDQPTAAQVEAIRSLIARLRELGVTGKPVEEKYRKAGLLERQRGTGRRYGSLLRPVSLSSNQVFQLLFCGQTLPAADAELVCRALGVWEDGEPGEDGLPQVVFTQPPDEEDDTSIAELKQFFLALIHACSLNVGIRVHIEEEREIPAPAPNGTAAGAVPSENPAPPVPPERPAAPELPPLPELTEASAEAAR